MYRWWDGQTWSASLSSTPNAAPPSAGLGAPQQQATPDPGHQTPGYGTQGYGTQPVATAPKSRKGLIALIAIGVVIVILIGLGIRQVGRVIAGGGNDPGGNSTAQICPDEDTSSDPPVASPNDGRVHGGALSYPRLPAPWSEPTGDNRVPFGRDVLSQTVFVEDYSEGSWVASVLVGELIAGDGFFTPQQGSEIVVKCVIGRFYGSNTDVARDDKTNKATKVDGKEAWLVESHLTFDIPGLKTKGETLIVLIVATGDATSSLFYASIPDTSPQYLDPARQAMKELKVTD